LSYYNLSIAEFKYPSIYVVIFVHFRDNYKLPPSATKIKRVGRNTPIKALYVN